MQGFIEHHRHLDVSHRMGTLLEFAQAAGLEPQSTSVEAFREKIVIRKPMKGLGEVLDQFEMIPKVMSRPEHLERLAFEAVEDAFHEGLAGVEYRWGA